MSNTAVSIDWVLNQLAGMKFPEQGGAYDFIKQCWESSEAERKKEPVTEGLTFHVFARGDRTVGDGDHYAIVQIPYANVKDLDYREFVRDELRATFADIFDNKDVRVQTQKEKDEEDRAIVIEEETIDAIDNSLADAIDEVTALGYRDRDGRRWTP